MPFTAEQFRNELDNIATLRAAGASVPEEYDRVLSAWNAVKLDTRAAVDRLAAAIFDGADAATISDLTGAAVVTGNDGAVEPIRAALRSDVGERLARLYNGVSVDNFHVFADRFDAAFTKLQQAAALVNLEADAESILDAKPHAIRAWREAPALARELDHLLPTLVMAAKMTRRLRDGATEAEGLGKDDWYLSLVVTEPEQYGIRDLWAAWDTTGGRTGRWGALVDAGVQVRTVRDLDSFQAHRRPWETFTKHVQTGRGKYEQVVVDPEAPQTYGEKPPSVRAAVNVFSVRTR